MIAITFLAVAACGGGDSDLDGYGSLSVSITDAPIHEAQSVTVNFIGVEVMPEDGSRLAFYFCKDLTGPIGSPPIVQDSECADGEQHIEMIDLLQQTGGASALLLDGAVVPAGRITWLRLMLADPAGEIVLNTGTYTLTVPSGSQTGLKLIRGFDVPEEGGTHVFIDFDVRKSIVEVHSRVPPGVPPSYKLKPVLRLVERDVYGAIEGEVAASLMDPACLGGAVYVFEGADATPDDIDGDAGDPISSAVVVDDTDSSTLFSYHAGFLEPGDYTVAFVCAGGLPPEPADSPGDDDLLSFTLGEDSATLGPNETVRVDIFSEQE